MRSRRLMVLAVGHQALRLQSSSTGNGGEPGTSSEAGGAPPPKPRPVRHGKESFLLEIEKAERAAAQASQPKPNAKFLDTLSTIQRQNEAGAEGGPGKRKGFFSSERVSERKEKKKVAMETERKKLLVFRDVGMDLDKAILSRDILLVPKYFYYGVEYAIDNELERMLRYFNEHAINELKLINDGKLMRGPERLVKSGFMFPPVEKVSRLSSLVSNFTPGMSAKDAKLVPFGTASAHSNLAGGAIRRPTMVIFSQLGQKVGGQADRMWREIALAHTSPSFLSKVYPRMKVDADGGKATTTAERVTTITHTKPLDVLSMRSLDVQTYKWVHRLYVRRFLRSLLDNTYQVSTAPTTTTTTTMGTHASATVNAAEVSGSSPHGAAADSEDIRQAYNEWLLSTTVVGNGMLKPFFNVGVRNYLSPYVFLLDHKGNVRWMTAGLPDAKEREALPKLFQQLGLEYFRDR